MKWERRKKKWDDHVVIDAVFTWLMSGYCNPLVDDANGDTEGEDLWGKERLGLFLSKAHKKISSVQS